MAGDEAGFPAHDFVEVFADRRRRRPRLHDPRRRVGRPRVGARRARAPDHAHLPRCPGDRGSIAGDRAGRAAASCSSAVPTSNVVLGRVSRRMKSIRCPQLRGRRRHGHARAPTIRPTSAPRSRGEYQVCAERFGFGEAELRDDHAHRGRRRLLRRGSEGRAAQPALTPRRSVRSSPRRECLRQPATKETTMTVGKAKAHTAEGRRGEFQFVVPCFTRSTRRASVTHLQRDHFFWLDLTAPSQDELDQLQRHLRLPPARARGQRGLRPAPQARRLRRLRLPRLLRRLARPGRRTRSRCARSTCSSPASTSSPPSRSAAGARSPARAARRPRAAQRAVPHLPRPRRAHRQLLPAARATWTTRSTTLEAAVLDEPDRTPARSGCSRSSGELVAMRKVVTPQRDLFARSVDQIAELPGLELDERDYFRDVYDHLIRISDLIDSYRDLLSGRHRPLPVDGQQPPERRDEAAHRDRHDLPAAGVHHRVLRPELRLPGHHA